jgi:hypothetical protein
MADPVETPPADTSESLTTFNLRENAAERTRKGLDPIQVVADAPVGDVTEAEPAAEAAATVPATAPAEADAQAEDDATATARDAKGKFAKKDPIQARIDKAVKSQRDAERARDAALEQLRQYESRAAAAPRPGRQPEDSSPAAIPTGAPRLDQFLDQPDPYAAHTQATADWARQQAVQDVMGFLRQQAVVEQAQQAMTDLRAAGEERHPDYLEVMQGEAGQIILPPYVHEVLRDATVPAEVRADVVYHLGTHADEARALAAAPPITAVLTLGKLLHQYAAAPSGSAEVPKVRSTARPPIKPVGASATIPVTGPVESAEKSTFLAFKRSEDAAEQRRKLLRHG